ncbi:general stress protein [Psychrobacillus sp. BL-248-WT-3]|uniref:general stress protein n=1 Tax=Psychrobacillus sp. BL-248-WT-3 TaxID=2725306 RepID=UPI001469DBAC|nr:general stress protein [Psychrobacillus sp. BL-248-WT-3]NME05948.1 general stress protein [Psychrobacillus sp. BL-248-WT-3]
MKNNVIGVYESEQQVKEVVEGLKEKGYTTEEISVIARNSKRDSEVTQEVKPSTKDGAIAGAVTGGAIGLAGVLVGLSTVLIPGFGAVLAAGPIMTTIGGAVVGANSSAGGLKHALMEIGVTDDEAERYSSDVENGKILVLIHPKE